MDEANQIEEIRRKVVEISSKEAPYDVFICYKESDRDGNRTEDSVLAQKIYEELLMKDYRVFFAKISLEDKLGQEYEPYIFAALHSAKVMLVVGTEYNNFDAVWVRNEWSRYLDIISKDKNKVLIPCYKDMDPYDLPKEFSGLQAQDMGKVGAIQDLVRGIEKVSSKGTASSANSGITEASLKAALKQEAKKRTIRTSIIAGVIIIAAGFAIFAGVKVLIEMIKNNKNTTIINNEKVVTETTAKPTTEATTEKAKEWKISTIVANTSETDMTTDKKTIPYGVSTVYFHFYIKDGPTDKGIKLYAVTRGGGQSEGNKYFFEDEWYVGTIENSGWANFYWYDMTTGDPQPIPRGNVSVEIYNAETDELLGGKTITIN